MELWQGKGKKLDAPAKFTADKDFMFGGKLVAKGSEVKQWETQNFGWTSWRSPDGVLHLAKE